MAKVTFDVERCKGCGLCETVCPKQIIALSKEKINAKMFIDLYALDPPEPVVVTTRALTPFEHETGSTDFSVLSISSPKKDSSHSSLGPTTQTYVRNLSNSFNCVLCVY